MTEFTNDDSIKALYKSTKKTPYYVDVPTMNYITYNGYGHPACEDFQDACNALFTLSYIIKFKIARAKKDISYKVNPLEVSWFLDKKDRTINFTWKAMIMQPPFITQDDFNDAIKIAKENGKLLKYEKVQFESLSFGKAIQCFHKGDYNLMNETMYKMQDLAKKEKLEFDLYTHDIYLNDSRKTKTENLKSIMRICIR